MQHQMQMFGDLLPVEAIQERARQIRLTARDLARLARCNENTLGHAFARKSRLQRATHQMIEAALKSEELRLFKHLKSVIDGFDQNGIAAAQVTIIWAVLLPFLMVEFG